MRAMRACFAANAAALGLLTAVFGFAACAGGSTPPGSTPTPDGAVTVTTVIPLVTAAPPPQKAKPAPRTAADCKELISDITNDPPANGVPLNNAMTSKDAGSQDRLEPLTELVKSKRDGFRCCFDIHARTHPGAAGAVKMVLVIKPDGTLKGVSFADAPNRVNAPDVESCMSDLAKGLTYPRSPSGKETKFTYPFDFKARK